MKYLLLLCKILRDVREQLYSVGIKYYVNFCLKTISCNYDTGMRQILTTLYGIYFATTLARFLIDKDRFIFFHLPICPRESIVNQSHIH